MSTEAKFRAEFIFWVANALGCSPRVAPRGGTQECLCPDFQIYLDIKCHMSTEAKFCAEFKFWVANALR